MTKSGMTATDKDNLIAQAAQHNLTITRTSKDFFHVFGDEQRRVTPTDIKRLIVEAQIEAEVRAEEEEETARIEALALADELRSEEAGQAAAPVLEEPVKEEVSAAPETQIQSEVNHAPNTEPVKKPKAVKYGPPCGGDIIHLPIVHSEDARNPIVHLTMEIPLDYRTKAEAVEAGQFKMRNGARGFLAFMARYGAEEFWVVATVDDGGKLSVHGTEMELALLSGQEAEAAREKLATKNLKAKSQWVATAV